MPSILPQGLRQKVRYEPPHGLAFFLLELLQILEDRIVDFERDFHNSGDELMNIRCQDI